MIQQYDLRQLPPHNREDLNYFLSLQKYAFPADPRYTPEKWDQRADIWEKERKSQQFSDQRVESTLAYLNQKGILTPDCRVADIGCGPGRFAAAFGPLVDCVVGYDISPRMVAHGAARLEALGLKNVRLHCCDFDGLDIDKEGCRGAFDLVFASLSPAVHSTAGLMKAIAMSRAWCLSISHLRRQNQLREQLLREVFHRTPGVREDGRVFYAMFNTLFLLGYRPETSYVTRRKESRLRPDKAYAEYIMELALPLQEQSEENRRKISAWLAAHCDGEGYVTEVSEAVYGRILWDTRIQDPRPDYRSLL